MRRRRGTCNEFRRKERHGREGLQRRPGRKRKKTMTEYLRQGISFRKPECAEIARLLPFSLGEAVRHVWKMDKGTAKKDAEEAEWYFSDALARPSYTGKEAMALGVVGAMEAGNVADGERLQIISGMIAAAALPGGDQFIKRQELVKRIKQLAELLEGDAPEYHPAEEI